MNLNPKCPQKKSSFSSLFKYSTDFPYIAILEIFDEPPYQIKDILWRKVIVIRVKSKWMHMTINDLF